MKTQSELNTTGTAERREVVSRARPGSRSRQRNVMMSGQALLLATLILVTAIVLSDWLSGDGL